MGPEDFRELVLNSALVACAIELFIIFKLQCRIEDLEVNHVRNREDLQSKD